MTTDVIKDMRICLIVESWLFISDKPRYEETLEALAWIENEDNQKQFLATGEAPKRVRLAYRIVVDPWRRYKYVSYEAVKL